MTMRPAVVVVPSLLSMSAACNPVSSASVLMKDRRDTEGLPLVR